MKLLLASKSPRRRQLLASLGYELECIAPDVDEHTSTPMPVADLAEHLACRKAAACRMPLPDGTVLVSADTVVVHDGEALGKPADRDKAVAMLQRLSGGNHTVYTGVCLRSNSLSMSFTEATTVHFRPLSNEEINYYIDNYRPYDKAGAYGIQEWIGMVGIDRIEGCYYNVVGLPVARLCKELSAFV